MALTKTKHEFKIFGITIPKGYPVEETQSCACIARYGEGCSFTLEKGKGYMKPKVGFPVAVGNSHRE